ncbi:NrtR DNA-binding winged helix domain-containing protein [Endozoicomonas sp.]|uniref:NUDIX hydrolase n=1 Tax=Endozoicomonas sp. TaxID=1892382 RepID=UPI0028882D34|nr:NUDIX hydrolase [Endozoicomonas sp.]
MSLSTTLISVDLVAFKLASNNRLQVLTHQLPENPLPQLPAGRIEAEQDQSLEDTAKRQLERFTREPATYYEQVITIGDNHRDSRGWSLTVIYYALLRPCDEQLLSDDARWIDIIDGQPAELLAYDHSQLVMEALERLRNKIQYSALPIYLLSEAFTLSDIQAVFSVILGKAPPMRSIRNRFLSNETLMETGDKRYGSNRPAALYRINLASENILFDRLYLSTQG